MVLFCILFLPSRNVRFHLVQNKVWNLKAFNVIIVNGDIQPATKEHILVLTHVLQNNPSLLHFIRLLIIASQSFNVFQQHDVGASTRSWHQFVLRQPFLVICITCIFEQSWMFHIKSSACLGKSQRFVGPAGIKTRTY